MIRSLISLKTFVLRYAYFFFCILYFCVFLWPVMAEKQGEILTSLSDQTQRIENGWHFIRKDIGGWWELWRKASHTIEWIPVNLPHCFNADDAVDPDVEYYQGPAWYRKRLKINNPYSNGRTLLHFEGAGQKTQVWVYDQLVGEHVGGYDEFIVDISDAVEKFQACSAFTKEFKNRLSLKGHIPIGIRCDNTRDLEMLPSDLSDFNLYGGLYRNINLVYVPQVSLEQIHMRTTKRGPQEWLLEVIGRLYNPEELDSALEIDIEVLDPEGESVLSKEVKLEPWEKEKTIFSKIVKSPKLWSPSQPSLYQCFVKLNSRAGGQICQERFGFRWFEFVQKGPFCLNGQRLLLRGMHRHEDHAGLGAAVTDEIMAREMEMMKDMGVNFIRLAHYQQSRRILELCDELGILVWEEIPWCRGGIGGIDHRNQARRMLTNMIEQHYNHPSVILWGLGNEVDWKGDFPEFNEQQIKEFMNELNDLAHDLDPQRKTCIRRCDFCSDIVDVYSPSIWAGWYHGKFTEYKNISLRHMENVDHFLHVEWGASHHARRHSEDPDKGLENIKTGSGADERPGDYLMKGGEFRVSKDGDWSETYACNLIDWHLKEQETMDSLTGTAYWPFKDFSTPVRPENPVPYVNQKGVVERDLRPKESYYVFQSYWSEKPMVHIYGHSWPVRWGKTGERKLFKVYSNCSEVELFFNGKSMGVKHRNSQDFPAAGLRWVIPMEAGIHYFKAIGKSCGEEVADEIQFRYEDREWSKPAVLSLTEFRREGDKAMVEVILKDEKGIICLDSTEVIRWGLTGDGQLIENLGTSDGSRVVQLCNGRSQIQVDLKAGQSVVSASCNDLETVFLSLKSNAKIKIPTSDNRVISD